VAGPGTDPDWPGEERTVPGPRACAATGEDWPPGFPADGSAPGAMAVTGRAAAPDSIVTATMLAVTATAAVSSAQ
jgi:hypothetical protein